MAAGPGLGRGANVLLKWTGAVVPTSRPGGRGTSPDGSFHFQKKSKSRLLPKFLGLTQM